MTTQRYALKKSRHSRVLSVLVACFSYTGIETAFSVDLPVSGLEVPSPTFTSEPLAVDTPLPIDNPIGAILFSKQHPLLSRNDFTRVSDYVNQIYRNANFQAIWFTTNRSEKNLQDLLSILNNAPMDALNPVNYDVDRIKEWISSQNLDNNTIASYDVALTVSLVRFLHDLRQGQVEPRDIQYPIHIAPKPPVDIAGLLKLHLASQNLAELVVQFEPKSKQYRQLKQILNRSRPLTNQASLGEFKLAKALRPGEQHPLIVKLRQRLQMMGMIESNLVNDSKTYDADLVTTVKKIQQQQGLPANGIIGPATVALFNLSSNEKIMQIQLAMERARWIPDATDGPMIVVNIPAFELWAFNSADDAKPLNMKVVVGKSPDNQTPVLWEEMKYLEFMPYWNIPKTIFEKEIRPKVAKNISYLASQDIELIQHQNSEEQGGGHYIRARQRPGKKNPLGRVKFVFPNTADVYLHDTPGRAAFNRPRRDLSHGCVRVSEPEQLAEFVLGDQEGWDKASIKQAMSAPKTRHVTLKRSVPVLFYYGTTFVDHENQLRFYPDVYGQDEILKKALNKLQAPVSENMVKSESKNQVATNDKAI